MKGKKLKKLVLTKAEWRHVFKARCKSKQGLALSDAEKDLVGAAWWSDQKRYERMETDVFNATVPFGSTVRR